VKPTNSRLENSALTNFSHGERRQSEHEIVVFRSAYVTKLAAIQEGAQEDGFNGEAEEDDVSISSLPTEQDAHEVQ
jgi:hypothetical protein